MSGLRFFDDLMAEALEMAALRARAKAYEQRCEQERAQNLPRGDEIPEGFHKANEGLCAVRIIMGEAK